MCASFFEKTGVQAAHNPHSSRNEATVFFFYPFILPALPAWSLCSSYLMREQYPLTPHCSSHHQPPDSNNHGQDFLCSCIRAFLLLQNTPGLSHTYKSIKDSAGKQGEHRSSSKFPSHHHNTGTKKGIATQEPELHQGQKSPYLILLHLFALLYPSNDPIKSVTI